MGLGCVVYYVSYVSSIVGIYVLKGGIMVDSGINMIGFFSRLIKLFCLGCLFIVCVFCPAVICVITAGYCVLVVGDKVFVGVVCFV